MNQYVIKDLYHDNEMEIYLNKDTTSLEDIWHSFWPKNKVKDERYSPKIFTDMKEAKRYLKEVKRKAKIDWQENAHMLKIYGKRKPEWDIYEFEHETGNFN